MLTPRVHLDKTVESFQLSTLRDMGFLTSPGISVNVQYDQGDAHNALREWKTVAREIETKLREAL